MHALNTNRFHLVDLIDPNVTFINRLGDVECITSQQREHLNNIPQPRDRTKELIGFLTRRSVRDFEEFTRVLAEYQKHLVPLLHTDGGESL